MAGAAAAAFVATRKNKRDGDDDEEDVNGAASESATIAAPGGQGGLSTPAAAAAAAAAVSASPQALPPPTSAAAASEAEAPKGVNWWDAIPTPDHPEKLSHQHLVYKIYYSTPVQYAVAVLIAANFFVTICEKEIDPFQPENQRYRSVWVALDATFNSLFLVELIFNLWGSWWSPFWKSGWNIFDLIVVISGFLTMSGQLPESLRQMKMLRAFRVFRLFKRIESLNKIVTALFRAIPGVINAFVIMIIVMAIYAILGVEYFSEFGSGTGCGDTGHETCYQTVTAWGEAPHDLVYNTTNVDSMSLRQMPYGFEYYGTFFRALYTLFQVLTGESWSEAVARPLIFGRDENWNAPWFSAIYFASFIVITQIVLVNVVVAVLLDKFVTTDDDDKPSDSAAEQELVALREEVKELREAFDSQVKGLQGTLVQVQAALESAKEHLTQSRGVDGVRAPAPAQSGVDDSAFRA